MDPDLFVPAADHFHFDLAARKIELDEKLAVLADQIKLLDADGTNYESDPGLADIGRLAADGQALDRSVKVACGLDGLERHTYRSIALSPYRVRVAFQNARQFCHKLTDHAGLKKQPKFLEFNNLTPFLQKRQVLVYLRLTPVSFVERLTAVIDALHPGLSFCIKLEQKRKLSAFSVSRRGCGGTVPLSVGGQLQRIVVTGRLR